MVRLQYIICNCLKKQNISKFCLITGLFLIGSLMVWQFKRTSSPTIRIPVNSEHLIDTLPRPQLLHHIRNMEMINFGPKKLIHLDLKGAPAKISYYEELFPVLRQWGATGLLVEWEDTFPYWGAQLAVIGSSGPDSPGLYSHRDLEEFLNLATHFDLEVIPLIQTFGHFEFVLKHDAFRSLREVESFPSSLCPSHSEAIPLVQAMLAQVINLHPNITTLHIGADEVWHMGLCAACKHRMAQMPLSQNSSARDRLFLEHVASVLRWLKSNYPNLQLLMWDDMLRHIDPLLLQEYELGKLVEPMIWHYRPAKTFNLPDDLWVKYSRVFSGVWLATAFKGASGSNAQLPYIAQHLDCQEHWIQLLQALHERGNLPTLRGVAVTGWSRYDHYAVICELLPVALPSLALCLAQLQTGAFTSDVHRNVSLMLGYPEGQLLSLQPQPQQHQPNNELKFPGWKIRIGVEWLVSVQANVKSVIDSEQSQTWLNPYLVRQSFSSPARIVSLRRKYRRVQSWLSPWLAKRNFTNPMQLTSLCQAISSLLDELASIERFLRPNLDSILPTLAVEEWFGTTVEPGRERLRHLLQEAERQVALGGRVRNYNVMV